MLKKANDNLSKLFPNKHYPITEKDIEAVYNRNILSVNVDAKTKKGLKRGYLTGILYLASARISGINMCPMASKGCEKACLFTAGRGRFYNVTRARVIKTLAYNLDKGRFIDTISKSIAKLERKAKQSNLILCIRLNGTSDVLWENIKNAQNKTIFDLFPNLQFYDYTKFHQRFDNKLDSNWPKNYSLTYSHSENSINHTLNILKNNGSVAVVFKNAPIAFNGFKVYNGDETDLRFLDDAKSVIALSAKGEAKYDISGFVQ